MAARMALLAIPAVVGLFLSPVIVPAVLVGDDHDTTAVPTVTADRSGCSMFCAEVAECSMFCENPAPTEKTPAEGSPDFEICIRCGLPIPGLGLPREAA
ncbi:hypothetical protein [Nocardia sp. NPDC050718]|uniref:hypothetical protein n=1 Tax=Nocardia sp. NPDC050718 TaxID=3155788 RepID=UPI0033C363E2